MIVSTAKPVDYDAAFNDLASLPDEPDRLKALAGETPAEEAPVEEASAEEAPVEEAPVGEAPAEGEEASPEGEEALAEGEEGEEGEEDEEGDEPPAATDDDELLERLSRLLSERGDKKPEPKTEPKTEAAPEPEIYTAEEQDVIDAYRKDWPDIAKAEQLVRRAEYRNIVSYVFEQIGAELRPLMETVGAVAERTHLGDLTERVPDYGDVRDKVVAWVDTQPGYLQEAYTRVIKEGTVEEVTDLIDRYRQANPAARAPAQPAKKEPELPPTTRKAAQSLAPVSSKRSVVPSGEDLSDFESAFDKSAEKL